MPIIKKADIILIAALVLSAVLFLIFFNPETIPNGKSTVTITVRGEIFAQVPLHQTPFEDENTDIEIPAPDGTIGNIVTISGGKVKMSYADCHDGLCVKQGALMSGGRLIVCLPNAVIVEITGSAPSDGIDAVSQ